MADTKKLDLKLLQPILGQFTSAGRDQLLPALLEAQKLYGHLPEDVVNAIAKSLQVPQAEIYGVIRFYSMLYDQASGRTIVRVCTGPCCAMLGSEQALEAVCKHFGVRPGQPTPDGAFMIEEAPCLGLCDHAPAATVGDTAVAGIDWEQPDSWIKQPQPAPLGAIGGDPRWLTGRCGEIDPLDLPAFESRGGFVGLRKALLESKPSEVVASIKASGLVGRGGAAFPTGLKWEFTAATEAGPRFLVCNGDESEPGTFKDRVLMEGDPFSVLEGMAIAGYAIGANQGYLYVRGEYPRAQSILNRAIEIAHKGGYLGDNILGSGFTFEVEVRSGAGAYICGEETALFESIEGKRGHPRLKPPYPTSHGLFGKPTAINNVETLCGAAWIMAHGADAYRSVGTQGSPGAKLFCLSGDVERPGIYEVPFGTELGRLVMLAGGVQGELKAALLGGAAGAFAGADQLDLKMSFEALKEADLPLGSGVVMVFNQDRDLRQVLRSLAAFFAHESCGKCFPCQLGTQRQLEIVEKIVEGKAKKGDLQALQDIGFAMAHASLCGLGMTASTAILSALKKWPELARGGK
jgi:NADH-quinone oxidoreductase subunit F